MGPDVRRKVAGMGRDDRQPLLDLVDLRGRVREVEEGVDGWGLPPGPEQDGGDEDELEGSVEVLRSVDDRKGCFRVRARVSSESGVEVVAVVTGRVKVGLGYLVLLALCLLETDDVRVLGRQPVEKSLARRGTDAIGVEGDDAHGRKV